MQALLALGWSGHMDGFSLDLLIFLIATFAGALVAGLSGFAFALVAASICASECPRSRMRSTTRAVPIAEGVHSPS